MPESVTPYFKISEKVALTFGAHAALDPCAGLASCVSII